MDRRRALGLFATAIDVSISSQAHAFADALKTVSGNLPPLPRRGNWLRGPWALLPFPVEQSRVTV